MKLPARATTIIAHLRRLERQRTALLDGLLTPSSLLKGSLSLVNRTCGKSNCHCARGSGHPVWVLATSRDGQPRRQVVRKADLEQVKQKVTEYQQFKDAMRRLEAIDQEEKQLLKGLLEKRHVAYE